MSLAPNLERRGAIYYWRRRLPRALALSTGRKSVKLSLRTAEPRQARFLGAQLDAEATRLFMSLPETAITEAQLTQLFKETLRRHDAKLALVADLARTEATFDPDAEIAQETVQGWAYRLSSCRGPGARLTATDRAMLAAEGLSPETIEAVGHFLHAMRRVDHMRPSLSKLTELIEKVGAQPTAGNVASATPIYMRGMSEALLRARTRYKGDRLPYEAIVAATFAPAAAGPAFAATTDPAVTPEPVAASAGAAASQPVPAAPAPGVASDISAADAPDDRFATWADKLMKESVQDGRWTPKTVRQAAMIYDLFGRFMAQECKITGFTALRQHHCAAFVQFLRELRPTYGKSPGDRNRPVAELRAIVDGSKGPRGLAIGTRNRHLTFLGQLLAAARIGGVVVDPRVGFTALRTKRVKRARDERRPAALVAVEAFFRQPPFGGCRDFDAVDKPGEMVFHRGAYFVPMLACYAGLRREEACGLTVDDIAERGGTHCLLIRPNALRRLKNPQSERLIALHPELIRLGLLDYRDAVRQAGYEALFPELNSGDPERPLGDRLYDELAPMLAAAGFSLHALRHYFSNALKQALVSAEIRADLMGHGGLTETTERYVEAIGVRVQIEALALLPKVTETLVPAPIRLVPWVVRGEAAPWVRARGRPHRRVGETESAKVRRPRRDRAASGEPPI